MTQQNATPERPDDAVWFGLEAETPAGWARVDEKRLGGKWWPIDKFTPSEVAVGMGGGTYRVIWAQRDRRRLISTSLPFEVVDPPPLNEATPPQPPAPDVAEAAEPQQQPPQPAAPVHNADPIAEQPPPKRTNGRSRPATDMPTMPMEALTGAELHPLGQTVYLHSIAQAHTDKFHTLLLQSMQVMIESERARAREHAEALKAHYEALDANRTELTRMILTLGQQQREATPPPSPELAAVVEQLKQLSQHVEELSEDDDEREDMAQALAKLSDNPNDLERVLAGIQNVIGTLANSPIGAALAAKLEASQQHHEPPHHMPPEE